jgi:hypothetical protein
MFPSTKRPGGWLVAVALLILVSACTRRAGDPTSAGAAQQTPGPEVPAAPSQIQLSEPQVTVVENDLKSDPPIVKVKLEVKYRFTQGQPSGHSYRLNLSLPDTKDQKMKLMEGWELKTEGTLRDEFSLSQAGAKSFEIQVLEGPSQKGPFKTVSNTVSGPVK